MTITMIALIAGALIWGALAANGALQRGDHIASIRGNSGPLAVNAQNLYRALSDADATAAQAFLSAGAEPPDLRARYLADIATAGSALVTASVDAGRDPELAAALARISAGLPVYTGLVDTARTNNRLGYPVGAAYLRSASAYMTGTLLVDAKRVYDAEAARVTDDRDAAAQYPWLAVPLGLVLLFLLWRVQRDLSRRTRRTVNVGLITATGAVVVALIWTNFAWVAMSRDLEKSRASGTDTLAALSTARFALLDGRRDEALTLIARGSGQDYEKHFQDQMQTVVPTLRAVTDASAQAATAVGEISLITGTHTEIRKADDAGDSGKAITLAIGPDKTDAPANWTKIDADIKAGIDSATAAFTSGSADAGKANRPVALVILFLAVAGAATIGLGFQRRIAEYR
jgi:hypothetical protein